VVKRPAWIAPITIPTVHYLAKRNGGFPAAATVTADLLRLLRVASLDNHDYYDALAFKDVEYEDALQFVTCRRVAASFLVTRSDFGVKRAPAQRRTAAGCCLSLKDEFLLQATPVFVAASVGQ